MFSTTLVVLFLTAQLVTGRQTCRVLKIAVSCAEDSSREGLSCNDYTIAAAKSYSCGGRNAYHKGSPDLVSNDCYSGRESKCVYEVSNSPFLTGLPETDTRAFYDID